MKNPWSRLSFARGFTLMEMIAVLIIIGIVSTVIAVRMYDTRHYDIASQLEVVKSHLRYAQSKAMSSGSSWGINFNSSQTYYLFDAKAPTTPVIMLGEQNAVVNLGAGGKKSELTITSAPQVITFDAYGSPGQTALTVSTNGGDIVITKNTGFIP
ncbi:MAG TPA: type II secretion system protein [Smithella sp.]|nr:type II secretion system protein [Smithella sp.]